MFESIRKQSTVNDNVGSLASYEILKLSKVNGTDCINSKILGFIKSKDVGYGPSILLVLSNGKMVSLPKRYVEKFDKLTSEETDLLKSGTLTFVSADEFSTPKGITYGFTLRHGNDNISF